MQMDDAALRREFEERHASLSEKDLRRILHVNDPRSSFYLMPDELLSRTLESVRKGYEDFIQERPEYPQYFTKSELEANLAAYLDGMEDGFRTGVPDVGELDIDWSDVLDVHVPDEGDFSYTYYELVPYGDGTTSMPVGELDEEGYRLALEDAVAEARLRAPGAVTEVVHEFERDKAYFVALDAGWEKPPVELDGVESNYYDNTETFVHRNDPDYEPWDTGSYDL